MTPSAGAPSARPCGRVRVAGKFFRIAAAEDKEATAADWWLNGVSYGPFPPNPSGEPYPPPERLDADLKMIGAMGFNTLRLYQPPTPALLEAASRYELRLLVTLSWTDHVDFLARSRERRAIVETVLKQVRSLADLPQVAAVLVGNEIEKGLVRWMGPRRVQHFLEELIAACRRAAPDLLFGYASYPSTEYLMPRTADFFAVNLYLETPEELSLYLRRLQHLAGNQPLLVAEFGLDVKRHGVERQAEVLRWQRRVVLEEGVAGSVWFAFTDEWERGGRLVTGWQFGLMDSARHPRPACALASTLPRELLVPADTPLVSVIICTRNGSATLRPCLESLTRLRYPAYEVVVIDDGSTDAVPEIVRDFPQARYVRQEAAGLSLARNRGMQEARGQILAYTDDDCIAHPDWLLRLSRAFNSSPKVVAAGGPNIPPPPRNGIEAVVAAAPGAPAHVLVSDTEAEHLPGCNLAIRKEALERVGGFNPVFTAAGDDVDICWRLREAGGSLQFVAAAMVWHHRRFTVSAYLRQQRGYGRAEALLMKAHPAHFGPLGGARWRGCIYGAVPPTSDPAEGAIYFGPLGNGLFQGIYRQASSYLLEWGAGLLWPALAALALALRQPQIAAMLLLTAWFLAGVRRRRLPTPPFPLRPAQRLLLTLLCFLQPMVREAARVWGMIRLRARPRGAPSAAVSEVPPPRPRPQKLTVPVRTVAYWSETGADRHAWLAAFQKELEAIQLPARRDDGWRRFDYEAYPRDELSPAVLSVTEYHGEGRCLTRLRFLLRCTPGLVVSLLLLLALETALVLSVNPQWQVIGSASLGLTGLMVLTAPWWVMRPLRRAARVASLRAGLQPLNASRAKPVVDASDKVAPATAAR